MTQVHRVMCSFNIAMQRVGFYLNIGIERLVKGKTDAASAVVANSQEGQALSDKLDLLKAEVIVPGSDLVLGEK